MFALYVGLFHGQLDQWPRYAIACASAAVGIATAPLLRGGFFVDAATAASVPKAIRAWYAVLFLIGLVGFVLGQLSDFSRLWFVSWVVVGGTYLVISRAYHAGRRWPADNKTDVRRLFGINVSAMTGTQAMKEIDRTFISGQAIKVAFANANTFNLANRSPNLRTRLQEFVVLNDGLGIDIASRLRFGRRFPENLNGTDFVPRYLQSTHLQLRIYLLGARPGVVATAAECVRYSFPQHHVVGFWHGYFSDADVASICRDIRTKKANLVMVALGSPAQELWISDHATATGATMFFGVGGLFDFLAGQSVRAPLWIRRWRFEWAYRLAREPRRLWRRYIVGNVAFLRDALLETRG